jgi:hypothetical protein
MILNINQNNSFSRFNSVIYWLPIFKLDFWNRENNIFIIIQSVKQNPGHRRDFVKIKNKNKINFKNFCRSNNSLRHWGRLFERQNCSFSLGRSPLRLTGVSPQLVIEVGDFWKKDWSIPECFNLVRKKLAVFNHLRSTNHFFLLSKVGFDSYFCHKPAT